MRKVIGIGETVLDIIFKDGKPIEAVPGGSAFNAMISLGRAGVNTPFISEAGNDRIGKYAGGGSIVPITGFANSVVSPAMEFKTEGFVYGVAAKMFVIAGPIIVFGIASGVLVGLVYYIGYRIF